MRCLVTGATGFVGRALCERLDSAGIEVIATSRRGGNLGSEYTVYALDLETQGVPVKWLAETDAVIHLAGIAHRDATDSSYESLNYRATLQLAADAASAGVKSFLFLSSVKAMGPSPDASLRSEEHCYPPVDAYGRFKRQAEVELQAAYEHSEMSVVILRPALVYGVGAVGNLDLLTKAVNAGLPRPPELGGRSMIAVDDLTALLEQLLLEPPGGFRLWIVCDGRTYSASNIFGSLQSASGVRPSSCWLPLWVWRSVCALRDVASKKPVGTMYEKIFGSEVYSNARLLTSVNWRPLIGFEQVAKRVMSGDR